MENISSYNLYNSKENCFYKKNTNSIKQLTNDWVNVYSASDTLQIK